MLNGELKDCKTTIMASSYLTLRVLSRQMPFFGKLQRCVLSSWSSNYHTAVSASHLHHSAKGKLHTADNILEITCVLRKSRMFATCSTSYPVFMDRRILSMFHKVGKLKCGQAIAQPAPFASHFSSTSASYSDTEPAVITLIETEDDLETFLSQVRSVLNLAEPSKTYVISVQNLRPLVQKLVHLDCDCRSILAMLVANPGILSVKMDKLLSNIDHLHLLGLNWRRLMKALDGNASLWKASLQQLQSRVKQLRKLGFVEGQLQKLIADWPQILTICSAQLNAVVKLLMEKCRFPRAEVLTILSDSPAILKEDLESIELRFQYSYFRMGIQNNSDMTQAKIFKYSLDHLRCRHLILERLGLYAAPNNRGHFAMKNPSLSRLIDSSERRFTEKVAKISMEEYVTFTKMLLEEIEVEKTNKDRHPCRAILDEFTDEDSHYDDDTDDDIDSDSDFELSQDGVTETEPFNFDKVDYRTKR